MKCVKWLTIGGFVAVCILLYMGKDDMRRMRQMRQMLLG